MAPGPTTEDQDPAIAARKNVAVPSLKTPGHKSVLNNYIAAVSQKKGNKSSFAGKSSDESDADSSTRLVSSEAKPVPVPVPVPAQKEATPTPPPAKSPVPSHKATLSGYMLAIQATKKKATSSSIPQTTPPEPDDGMTSETTKTPITKKKAEPGNSEASKARVPGHRAVLAGYMAAVGSKTETNESAIVSTSPMKTKEPTMPVGNKTSPSSSAKTGKPVPPRHKAALSSYMAAVGPKKVQEVSHDDAPQPKTPVKKADTKKVTSEEVNAFGVSPPVPGHKAVLSGYMKAVKKTSEAEPSEKETTKVVEVAAKTPAAKPSVPKHKAALSGYMAAINAKKKAEEDPVKMKEVEQKSEAPPLPKRETTKSSENSTGVPGHKAALSGYMAAVGANRRAVDAASGEIVPVVPTKPSVKSSGLEPVSPATSAVSLQGVPTPGHKAVLSGYMAAVNSKKANGTTTKSATASPVKKAKQPSVLSAYTPATVSPKIPDQKAFGKDIVSGASPFTKPLPEESLMTTTVEKPQDGAATALISGVSNKPTSLESAPIQSSKDALTSKNDQTVASDPIGDDPIAQKRILSKLTHKRNC